MPHRYRVLLIVSVATFMASLDLFIVNIAFPTIQRDFAGTSDSTLSWVLSAYAIVTAALLVPAGRLADLFGRKRLFLAGLIDGGVVTGSGAAAGATTRGLSSLVRRVQSGNIRSYAGWLALGAAAVLLVMIFGRSIWPH